MMSTATRVLACKKAPRMYFFQSPRLCESDPTLWIVNGIVGSPRCRLRTILEIAPYCTNLNDDANPVPRAMYNINIP